MCQDRLAMASSNSNEAQQPENSDTMSTSRHRRNSFAEKDDGEFMKEEDAAILERGIRDSCSTGETPLLSHHVSNKDIPVMDLNDLFEDSSLHYSAAVKASSNNVIEEAGALLAQVESLGSSVTTERARRMYRRCLSGDIRRNSRHEDSEEFTDASPESVVDELHQLLVAETKQSPSSFDEDESAQAIQSSRTRDRLMTEVTQYAEAVGELPPCHEYELREIIDDEESASDESTEGIEVDGFKEERSNENEPPEKPFQETTRSDSFERKLREAKQYAEAVGELPPSDELQVREMIVDEASDDDDESTEAVCVEAATIPLASPKQKLSIEQEEKAVMGDETPLKPQLRKRELFKDNSGTFLHKLPAHTNSQDFVYKGICSNPPEVTKRGIQRGNYAQLHRKAWLEVSDKYHRYGKNLRLYYRYWERLEFPFNNFFDWLDSKGEAAGNPLPNLDECPRSELDSDTVLYITNPEVTEQYALTIIPEEGTGRGRVFDVNNNIVRTGSDGWIFVLRDNVVYGAQKITSVTGHSKQRFHHSSFFGGKAVRAAGILITDDEGYLTRLFPHSGHYRPGEAHMQRMLFFLHHIGISLRTFDLDTQQIFHVNRETTAADGEEKKKKKTDSLHPMPALYVASFLAHKARFIEAGIFAQIHMIRKADVTSVREALDEVDDGGAWKRKEDEVGEAGGSSNNAAASAAGNDDESYALSY